MSQVLFLAKILTEKSEEGFPSGMGRFLARLRNPAN
jgi:hypothetical protein